MAFYCFIELRALNGKTTRKTYKLQTTGNDGAAFVAALAATENIKDSLDSITEATIQDWGITFAVEGYTVGLGDITEQALLNVWAEDPDNAVDVLALSQVYIPAPVAGLFMGTSGSAMDVVDPSDAALQDFIDALAAGAYISDHEVIDVGTAVNGIENGRRVTRKSS